MEKVNLNEAESPQLNIGAISGCCSNDKPLNEIEYLVMCRYYSQDESRNEKDIEGTRQT